MVVGLVDMQARGAGNREVGGLRERYPLVGPVETRGSEQVDVQLAGRTVVNALGIFGVTLEAAPHTAPERLFGGAVHLVGSAQQRQKIANHAACGVLLGEDMVEQRTLGVVGDARIGLAAEEMTSEFQHIVGAACLARIAVYILRHLVGAEEVLLLAKRARGETVVGEH